jgi:SOS response associated peptidase (SRAP)
VPIVTLDEGQRKLSVAEWGFLAPWDKSKRIFNAAGETIAVKPTFRESFKARRCLISADGFYEWSNKQLTLIHFRDDRLFCFAGLWLDGTMTIDYLCPQRIHAGDSPSNAGDIVGRGSRHMARSTISPDQVASSDCDERLGRNAIGCNSKAEI